MAKNKAGRFQLKIKNKEKVDSLTQEMSSLEDSDQGAVLSRLGVTFLQSRMRPLRPTPEIRTIVNKIGRLTTLMRLMFDLISSRRVPVEDLGVISETKVREEVVDPINEILDKAIHDIEEVLNKNKDRANNKGKAKAKAKKQSQPVESIEAPESGETAENKAKAEPALEAESEIEVAAQA